MKACGARLSGYSTLELRVAEWLPEREGYPKSWTKALRRQDAVSSQQEQGRNNWHVEAHLVGRAEREKREDVQDGAEAEAVRGEAVHLTAVSQSAPTLLGHTRRAAAHDVEDGAQTIRVRIVT